MKSQNPLRRIFWLLLLVMLVNGCQPTAAVPPGSPKHYSPTTTAAQPAAQATAAPTQSRSSAPEQAPVEDGYVLFDPQKSEFHGYALDGKLLFTTPAPGLRYPSRYNAFPVNGAVYFKTDETGQVFRSSAGGVEPVNIPTKNLFTFAVSDDEKWLAWGNMNPENGDSELWIAKRDGSDAHKAATYSRSNSTKFETFVFFPLEWTADGRLLFDRAITGVGGYIPFGGHNSLYSYDPASGQFTTLVPAEEMHGLSLDSYRPDLEKVVFNVSKQGSDIVIRDLLTQKETILPRLPEQGLAGSARYSPSGIWLAYAVAKGDPENESGQVIVVPADLSAAPTEVAKVEEKSFAYVQGWLDEDTLLFSRYSENNGSLWTVNVDGSGLKQVALGTFLGWIH